MQEVRRIRVQHLNDRNAIVNGRVKGKINVTRAFGVGYLKQVTSALLLFQSVLCGWWKFLCAALRMCSSSEHALCVVLSLSRTRTASTQSCRGFQMILCVGPPNHG
jgi:hypothetical protein